MQKTISFRTMSHKVPYNHGPPGNRSHTLLMTYEDKN